MNDVLSSWLPTQLKDGWRLTKNREFCSIVNGYPCPSEGFNTNGEGIPIVRIRDITSGSTNTYFKGEYPSEQIINTNDLLIGMDGDFNVRLWSSGKALLNQRCCNVRCKDELIKKYLYFVLPIQLKIINELKNSTTVKHLNNEDILDAQIVIPNKYDHISKIVNYLDSKTKCIDRILSVLNDILEKIIAYRQSLITRAVTKGLDPNVEMKDSGVAWIGKIPRNFKTIKLKYCLKSPLQYGATESGCAEEENYIRYIRITDINPSGFLKENGKLYLPKEIAEQYPVKTKDILFARSGATVGKTYFHNNKDDCCFAGYLIKASLSDSKILPKFFYYFTKSACYDFWKDITLSKATIQNISADRLNDLSVVCPPIQDQIQIIKFCDDLINETEAIAEIIKTTCNLLIEYRTSLISAAVTGQLAIDEEASA